MKILITGTTGFIGAYFLRHFSKLGHEMIAWSRPQNPPVGLTKFGTYQSVDLTKKVPQLQVDACIHCAGYASDQGNWDTFFNNNVVTTQNIFKAISAKLWINISSASIYPIKNQIISETDVDLNNFPSLYGKSKYIAEKYLENNLQPNQTIISLRPRAVYGKNDRVLLPRILNIGKTGVIKLPGGGNVDLSMTHISNLCHAIELCLTSNLQGFHAFNVADPAPYLLREVIQKINEEYLEKDILIKSVAPSLVKNIIKLTTFFGKPIPLTMQAFDYITTPTVIDISKIQQEMGYAPITSFWEQVADMMTWARSIPKEQMYSADKRLAWMNI